MADIGSRFIGFCDEAAPLRGKLLIAHITINCFSFLFYLVS
jgi:hypothetical protein